MNETDWTCLIPAAVTIAVAVWSRRPIESLLSGVAAGLFLLGPGDAFTSFSSILLAVMMDETIAWVIIVCGLMGSLITLLMRVGAANAFSRALAARAGSSTSALMYTWLLGLVIFIDDYLNALAVGSAMRKVTDKFKVSREMLAYVVDSTAAPVCMLIPISTWAVFFAGVLEVSDVAAKGEGINMFISAIPYMLYPWIAVIIVPLVITGRIPLVGPMKAAEKRAQSGEEQAVHIGTFQVEEKHDDGRVRIYHFMVPLMAMIGFSIYYDLDVQIGMILAVATTIILFGVQRLLPWTELFDGVMEGIKVMVPALTIIVVAFMFKEVNDRLGLAPYVIDGVKPWMTATMLPMVVFLTMALIAFATGSSWGVFAIAIPIVLPLAESVGVGAPLAIGALMSASAFGSHACFYSDATVLAAQGSGCGVMEHALTQFPYALLGGTLAAIGLTLLTLV
jgi:Na+/H+ antiporter NhaC